MRRHPVHSTISTYLQNWHWSPMVLFLQSRHLSLWLVLWHCECPLHSHPMSQLCPTKLKWHWHLSGSTQSPCRHPWLQMGLQLPSNSCRYPTLHLHWNPSNVSMHTWVTGSHVWWSFRHSFSGGQLMKFHEVCNTDSADLNFWSFLKLPKKINKQFCV